MAFSQKVSRVGDVVLRIGILLIIALGVVLRLVLFFQNRNLIIDEANIVRNLAERGFGGLVLPLRYEQYAPPVFLWIEKLSSLLFGYGEKAMRLYPLLCGIGALGVFYKIGELVMKKEVIWAPLGLFSFGIIYVEYSATMKQYMPDTFIALLLVWLALRWNMRSMHKGGFVLRWMLVGSLVIWSSMSSVFVLAGVGAYYMWDALKERRYKDIGLLCAIGGIWLVQFGLYYLAILKPQIGSEYLQNYHRDYFLYLLPHNYEEWKHNWKRFEEIIGNMGGWTTISIVLHMLLLFTGAIVLLRKHTARFFLIALPIGLVFIAAAFNQFSLISRVVLFMMPLWLLVIGVGYSTAWRLPVAVRCFLVILGVWSFVAYNSFKDMGVKYGFHEITEGMGYVKAKGGRGDQLYVHHASTPTYIYYTTLHPDKEQWKQLFGAHLLEWNSDYSAVTKDVKDTCYFLYTGGFGDDEKANRCRQIEVNMRQIGYFKKYICYVYAYVPK